MIVSCLAPSCAAVDRYVGQFLCEGEADNFDRLVSFFEQCAAITFQRVVSFSHADF